MFNLGSVFNINKEKYIISVIVPVYNGSTFIERNFSSLKSQPCFKDMEIIYIDDGSTDSSDKILYDIEQKYKNIKLVKQNNQGVAKARNNGIDIATGKYLIFLDVDDWWNINFFTNDIKQEMTRNTYDIYSFSFTRVSSDYKYYLIHHVENKVLAFGKKHALNRHDIENHHCSYAFRREFLITNYLKYPNVKYKEDDYFCVMCFYLCNICKCIDKNIFTYYTNSSSVTQTLNFESYFESRYKLLKFLEEWLYKQGDVNFNFSYDYALIFNYFLENLSTKLSYNNFVKNIFESDKYEFFLDKNNFEEIDFNTFIRPWITKSYYKYCNFRIKNKSRIIFKNIIKSNKPFKKVYNFYYLYKKKHYKRVYTSYEYNIAHQDFI